MTIKEIANLCGVDERNTLSTTEGIHEGPGNPKIWLRKSSCILQDVVTSKLIDTTGTVVGGCI